MKHIPKPFEPTVSRLSDLMAHASRYQFRGLSRLAQDAKVSKRALSRLIKGHHNASFVLVARVTEALERQFNRRIDPRDVIAELGQFLTHHACDVTGCSGCLPNASFDQFNQVVPAFETIRPGRWVTSKHPQGVQKGGEDA